MSRLRFAILELAALAAAASSARAQGQYTGYVYPAGGQQGTTVKVTLRLSAAVPSVALELRGAAKTPLRAAADSLINDLLNAEQLESGAIAMRQPDGRLRLGVGVGEVL